METLIFILSTLFWASVFLIFWNYIGYAIPIWVLNKLGLGRRRMDAMATSTLEDPPSVSFIVAIFNEEECIEEKIQNTLALDYPKEKIEFLFITDGSTDQTNDVIKRYPSVQLLFQPERNGKIAAVNRAATVAQNDILIFSDANTILNQEAIHFIVQHYKNPQVGGVAGEKRVIASQQDQEGVGEGEGLYWKYESFLKNLDASFHSVVGAAGELFSIRRSLHVATDPRVILDDFVISLKIAVKGFVIEYEPRAFAAELPSFSYYDEKKRKVRIAAGGFQAINMLWEIFYWWKFPRLTYLYFCHRFMRWAVSPFLLFLLVLITPLLAVLSDSFFYKLTFLFFIMYAMVLIFAHFKPSLLKKSKWVKLLHYFYFMNFSVILGFFRFIGSNQSAAWERSRRVTSS